MDSVPAIVFPREETARRHGLALMSSETHAIPLAIAMIHAWAIAALACATPAIQMQRRLHPPPPHRRRNRA